MENKQDKEVRLYEGSGVRLSVRTSYEDPKWPRYYLRLDMVTRGTSPADYVSICSELQHAHDKHGVSTELHGPSGEHTYTYEPNIEFHVFSKESEEKHFREYYEARDWKNAHTLPYKVTLYSEDAAHLSADQFLAELKESELFGIYGKMTERKLEGLAVKFQQIVLQAHQELDRKLGKNRYGNINIDEGLLDEIIPELDALKVTLGNHRDNEDNRPDGWSREK